VPLCDIFNFGFITFECHTHYRAYWYWRLCRHRGLECWSDCAAQRAELIGLRWSWFCPHETSRRGTLLRDEPSPDISHDNDINFTTRHIFNTAIGLRPLRRSASVSRHPQLRTGGFCWTAKFYCPHALADSNQRIQIREKTQCYLCCLSTTFDMPPISVRKCQYSCSFQLFCKLTNQNNWSTKIIDHNTLPVQQATSSLHHWWCSWSNQPVNHHPLSSAADCTSINHRIIGSKSNQFDSLKR